MSHFHPSQIVSLDHHYSRLYGEIIQVIESRDLCWVRPLFLVILDDNLGSINDLFSPKVLVDVRLTSDLLYPTKLFRPALDTEIIPWLNQLESQDYSTEGIQKARQQLHQFIFELWQTYRQEVTNNETASQS
ncbi:conserved hypothetical protein [Rippkaea orientalis PCC 8801]|uniref:Uncharacterized protein n=1 Tax=Rippkaea orientalis (strain PCC 8801 / RF-1) TaxID=41431 RepID=B7JW29_RIPO1|nr:hypothetical protein [Rippkaea orientalis]ACK65718.1 conserved hypothetical protein [Rippkaea orientalis PCC 8801]